MRSPGFTADEAFAVQHRYSSRAAHDPLERTGITPSQQQTCGVCCKQTLIGPTRCCNSGLCEPWQDAVCFCEYVFLQGYFPKCFCVG